MRRTPIYLDCHATTPLDPRVLEAMLPYLQERFGNAAGTGHLFGQAARDAVETARHSIARDIGAATDEIVFTSGATESNNLALRGLAEAPLRRGRHFVSVGSEHKSILDTLARLHRRGLEVTLLPVAPNDSREAGILDLDVFAKSLRDDTLCVSVMLANNEIGVIQPLMEIARICRARGILVHTDATQAVGKIPCHVSELGVDLLSFSAHKIYGPKGVGALFVSRETGLSRMEPLITGGGFQSGLRSGTPNVPGIIGFAKALRLATEETPAEMIRLARLQSLLFANLTTAIDGVHLNGPALRAFDSPKPPLRLVQNLNCRFDYVDGEALLMQAPEVALSSGSACTSADPEPSHVLTCLGLSDDEARSSLRFGLGRFNTEEDIRMAVDALAVAVRKLRALSSLS